MKLDGATKAIITVGEGRGFVIKARIELRDGEGHRLITERRYVITAAHCLPHLPPAHPASYTQERTYGHLLSRLNEEPSVWTECLFVDPVADIAVLGEPDDDAGLSDEWEAYVALIDAEDLEPFRIAEGKQKELAWLLSVEGHWFRCKYHGTSLYEAEKYIVGGMSGSPIVLEDGSAVGVLCTRNIEGGGRSRVGGPNPRLTDNLPAWLLR
jgi:hypothetical protein